MTFSLKDFFSKRGLVTFTEEIRSGKLHFLCSVIINLALLKSNLSKIIGEAFLEGLFVANRNRVSAVKMSAVKILTIKIELFKKFKVMEKLLI